MPHQHLEPCELELIQRVATLAAASCKTDSKAEQKRRGSNRQGERCWDGVRAPGVTF